jgi:uncharacterized integral membrane protein
MRTLIAGALLLFFLSVMGYLLYLNPEPVRIHLPLQQSYDIPAGQFGLGAFVLGGFVMLAMGGMRELRRLLRSWKEARRLAGAGDQRGGVGQAEGGDRLV